jgi:hypothetical protein
MHSAALLYREKSVRFYDVEIRNSDYSIYFTCSFIFKDLLQRKNVQLVRGPVKKSFS